MNCKQLKREQTQEGIKGVDYVTITCPHCGKEFNYSLKTLILNHSMRNCSTWSTVHCFNGIYCHHCRENVGPVWLKAIAFEVTDDPKKKKGNP